MNTITKPDMNSGQSFNGGNILVAHARWLFTEKGQVIISMG